MSDFADVSRLAMLAMIKHIRSGRSINIKYAEFEIIESKQLPSNEVLPDLGKCTEATESGSDDIVEKQINNMQIDFSDCNEQIDKIKQLSNLQCIAEHTVDLSLINRDSKVLDLGCRAFTWANAMLEHVGRVCCIDADDDIRQPDDGRLIFMVAAVDEPNAGRKDLIKSGNGTGNYLKKADDKEGLYYTVSLQFLCDFYNVDYWDLIKFDIEGSEIPVLLSLTKPPAKQLSVEWHMHTGTTKEKIHEVFAHLQSLGYARAYTDYSRKHGLCENYWDVCFILDYRGPNIETTLASDVKLWPS